MHRRDADNRLGPGLVDPGDLVKEYKRKFVFLVRYLDHIAIYGIESLGDIYRNFLRGHTYLMGAGPINIRRRREFLPQKQQVCFLGQSGSFNEHQALMHITY
jgi:hypothetical protein